MLGAVLKSFRPNSGLSSAISDDGRGKTMKFICENVFTTGRTSKNLSGAGAVNAICVDAEQRLAV